MANIAYIKANVNNNALTSTLIGSKINVVLQQGRQFRDRTIWSVPILPGAIFVWQQLASMREWKITGKPRTVSRAVEWIQNTRTVDMQTGHTSYGYEDFLKRSALDYLCVGRTSRYVPRSPKRHMEYLDTTQVVYRQNKNQPYWDYRHSDRDFRIHEVLNHSPLPVSSNRFIPPVSLVMPTAMLAYLIREHDSASLDGRKVREIFFVGDTAVKESFEEAVQAQLALHANDPNAQSQGIPVVYMNNPSGTPIDKLVTSLGLSSMPEHMDREQFTFGYVNEISATLSLALRHFWNNERTTNKALEQVQEQRQQLKGPATFVKSEERLINSPNIMGRFGKGKDQPRFAFAEETDMASRTQKAEVLERTTNALNSVIDAFGGSIDLQTYLRWMQSEGVLPNDLELVSNTQPEVIANPDEPLTESAQENDSKSYVPDYDEVTMDSNGRVVERRRKSFTIYDAITEDTLPPKTDLYEKTLQQRNLTDFRNAYTEGKISSETINLTQAFFPSSMVEETIKAALDSDSLNESQYDVLRTLLTYV